jgi:hypothetical protein
MNRSWLAALVSLVAPLIVLSGCASPGGTPPSQGQTPSYAAGYKDGCTSGRASKGSMFDFERKDARRFDSDKQYAQGWTDAFQACAYEQLQKMAAGR